MFAMPAISDEQRLAIEKRIKAHKERWNKKHFRELQNIDRYSVKVDDVYVDESPFEFHALPYIVYTRFIELLSSVTALNFMKTSKYNFANTLTRKGIECHSLTNNGCVYLETLTKVGDHYRVEREEMDEKFVPFFFPTYKMDFHMYVSSFPIAEIVVPLIKTYKKLTFLLSTDNTINWRPVVEKMIHPGLQTVKVNIHAHGNQFRPRDFGMLFQQFKICDNLTKFQLFYHHREEISPPMAPWKRLTEVFYLQHANMGKCAFYISPNKYEIHDKVLKLKTNEGNLVADFDLHG